MNQFTIIPSNVPVFQLRRIHLIYLWLQYLVKIHPQVVCPYDLLEALSSFNDTRTIAQSITVHYQILVSTKYTNNSR